MCAGPAPDAQCSIAISAGKAAGGSSEAAHERSSAAGVLLLPSLLRVFYVSPHAQLMPL